MDPIALATITSAVAHVGMEVGKGIASDAAKHAWGSIKSLMGWKVEPEPEHLAVETATKLAGNDDLMAQVLAALKKIEGSSDSKLVGSIHVGENGKVVVVKEMNISTGDFNM